MKPILYFARHASPDWDRKELIYYLPPGPPLTEHGKKEAKALATFLSTAGVRLLFSSPLERCLQTAQLVAEVLTLPIRITPELIEWQPGETEEEVQKRMMAAVAQALMIEQPACLITHGGPISAVLGALGMPPDERKRLSIFDHNNLVPPAGVWQALQEHAQSPWEMRLVFKPEIDIIRV